MSNELRCHVKLRYINDLIEKAVDRLWTVDIVGKPFAENVLELVASWESIPLADVANPGVIFLENLGDEDVEIGNGLTGPALLSIPAGTAAGPVQLHTAGFGSPAARATTDTTTLRYIVFSL